MKARGRQKETHRAKKETKEKEKGGRGFSMLPLVAAVFLFGVMIELEFRYLGYKLGDASFSDKANRVFEQFSTMKGTQGLFPIYVDPRNGGLKSRKITFGALGDSYYEYLLKTWLQSGKSADPEFDPSATGDDWFGDAEFVPSKVAGEMLANIQAAKSKDLFSDARCDEAKGDPSATLRSAQDDGADSFYIALSSSTAISTMPMTDTNQASVRSQAMPAT